MESQSLSKCSELREACQEKIFAKMDDQHGIQMKALGEIKTELAYQDGVENGRREELPISPNESNWKSMLFKVMLMWGPPFLFLSGLGCVYWLKSAGYL